MLWQLTIVWHQRYVADMIKFEHAQCRAAEISPDLKEMLHILNVVLYGI